MLFERRGGPTEFSGERHQLDDLDLGRGELVRNQHPEPILHRPAPTALPRGGQVGDLVEAAAELLGTR